MFYCPPRRERQYLTLGEQFNLIVTTYETFKNERRYFKNLPTWDCVILDEGHHIKNDQAQMAAALHQIRSLHRVILTG